MSTWIKIMNSLPAHPKAIRAGAAAMWLHISALCYSNEHLLDGRVDRAMLPAIAVGVPKAEQLVRRLVDVGLWDVAEDGWQIHDYEQYQRSANEIRKRRDASAKRQQAWRESRIEQQTSNSGDGA